MEKIKATHQSVADWDITPGIGKSLDTVTYVSAPSSLKLAYLEDTPAYGTLLCRIAETQCIAQGELRSWYRHTVNTTPAFWMFRNQAPLDHSNYLNTYLCSLYGLSFHFYRYNAGVPTGLGTINVGFATNQWFHLRLVFWNGQDAEGEPALCLEAYKEVEGEWVKQGNTLYDTVNQWKDSAVNRLGIGGKVDTFDLMNWDDTEIWGAI